MNTSHHFDWREAADGIKVEVYLTKDDISRLTAGAELQIVPGEDSEPVDGPEVVEVRISLMPE